MNVTKFKVVRDRWGDYHLFPAHATVKFDEEGWYESTKCDIAHFCGPVFQKQTGIRLKKKSVGVVEFSFKLVKS